MESELGRGSAFTLWLPATIRSGAGEADENQDRDGSAIQRTVAERHGIRRYAQRWTGQSVRRDYAIMREEIERAVRGRLRTGDRDATQALGILLRLVDRSAETSLAAWQQTALRHEH